MNIAETFSMALKNVLSNKMRTILTMLGIIIGVSAVVVIIGLGNGIAGYMEDSFSAMGTNSLTVSIMGRGSSRSVSVDDMYEIVEEGELLDKISPTVSVMGGVKIGTESVSSTSVSGVSEDYFAMKDYEISQGRGIEYMDIKDRKKVCVVGNYINQAYYGGAAVGDTIRISGNKFTIVGVMAQEAEEMEEGGTDDCVYMPYSTASRLSFGMINSYTVTVFDEEKASGAKEFIENKLYAIFNDENAYTVTSMAEMLDTMTSMVNIVIYVLAAIAGISLIVGGVGIMNIMLVSVTERTKEIGIRKALGAKESIIMRQFVVEAAMTSSLGGIAGIIIGYVLSAIATPIITSVMEETITVSPTFMSSLFAFAISAGIGILFGYLPAKKASQLNPIDALRYD